MRTIHSRLRSIATQARAMLVGRRLAQVTAGAIPVAITLALLDYWLRLPGAARLILLVGLLAVGGVWLVTRLRKALAFAPTLPELALRAEAAFPDLRGVFATAVELGNKPEALAKGSPITAQLAESTIARGRALAESKNLNAALLSWKTTGRALAIFGLTAAGLGITVAASPANAGVAAQRWLLPFSNAAWPTRQAITDLTEQSRFLPVEDRMLIRARVDRGFHDGQRMRVKWQVDGITQETIESLVHGNETVASGEVLLEMPHAVVAELTSGRKASTEVTYQIIVGDAQTPPASRTLAARPEITQVTATFTPPAYTAGLGDVSKPQTIELSKQEGAIATATALAGSRVNMEIRFNKPLDAAPEMATFAPGLDAARPTVTYNREDRILRAEFTLDNTLQTHLIPQDATALRSNSADREWRLIAQPDTLPSAALLDPASDTTALPTAWMPIQALGQDDLGLSQLRLDAGRRPEGDVAKAEALKVPADLTITGRNANLTLTGQYDLQPLGLQVNDVVALRALAKDVFDLNGIQHDEVPSQFRLVRIINESEFSAEIIAGLSGLRTAAQTAQAHQRRIMAEKLGLEDQGKLTGETDTLQARLTTLQARVKRNRPTTLGTLENVIASGGTLLGDAKAASADAADQLTAQKAEAALAAQNLTAKKLEDFISLLAMGPMIEQIKAEMKALITEQAAVGAATQALMPETLGQDPKSLGQDLREKLNQLDRKQDDIAKRSSGALSQMRALERSLGQQDEKTPDAMAARQVLANAANEGETKDLRGTTRGAEKDVGANRLSQAGGKQRTSGETMDDMVKKLDEFEKVREDIKAKMLKEVAAEVGKIAKEQADLDKTQQQTAPKDLPALQGKQNELNQRTSDAQNKANMAGAKPETTQKLGDAAKNQSKAAQAQGQQNKSEASEQGKQAEENLNKAKEELDEQSGDAAAKKDAEKKAKLRDEYLKLADRVKTLYTDLNPMLRDAAYTRAEWNKFNDDRTGATPAKPGFNDEQTAIRDAAKALGDQVKEDGSVVFDRVHAQVDAACERAQEGLDAFRDDNQVQYDQKRAERLLRAMADALKPQSGKPKKGGGGGGGGGGKQKLVPPLAEMMLLRESQQDLIDRTQLAEKSPEGRTKDNLTRDLGAEQRELKNTLEDFLKSQQQGQGSGPVQ